MDGELFFFAAFLFKPEKEALPRRIVAFLALRPGEVIPPEISGLGFNFGHALLGTTEFEVIQFVFHFYGFETYNMLVSPYNRLVKKVLMRMVESGDQFFFAIGPDRSVTAFRSEIGQGNLAGLWTNLRQIQGSTTTDAQYQRALVRFRRNPDPPGQVHNWVCRDNVDYLDLTQDRLEMNPAQIELPSFQDFFKNAHYDSDLVFAGYPSKRDFVKDFEQKFLTSDAYKQIETLYNRICKIIGENPQNSKE